MKWPKEILPSERAWLMVMPKIIRDAENCNIRMRRDEVGYREPVADRKPNELSLRIQRLYLAGLKQVEIARALEISQQSVSQHLKRF